MFDNMLYLLFAGIFDGLYPRPIPQGASRIYFFIAALLTSLTFAEASSLLNAERILRICWFPLPILVNMRNAINSVKKMLNGMAILKDLDKTM